MTGLTDQDVDTNLAVKMDRDVNMGGDDSSDDDKGIIWTLSILPHRYFFFFISLAPTGSSNPERHSFP